MFRLKDIRARLPRLRQRIEGLAEEIALWQTTENPLSPLERRAYVRGIHEALLGLDKAVVVLEKADERIAALDLPGEGDAPTDCS